MMGQLEKGTGVAIGRWQVPDLHAGHMLLLTEVRRRQKMLIFVGIHPALVTGTDPLDYPTRERMLRRKFPDATVAPLPDQPTDEGWSELLDRRIRELVPLGDVMLYGGRESFAKHYSGSFPVTIVEHDPQFSVSGTDVREAVGSVVGSTTDFRHGVIYASRNRRHDVCATVDVACVRKRVDRGQQPLYYALGEPGSTVREVLLGRKEGEPGLWRFPGGFVGLDDESYEAAARRELREEAGIWIDRGEMQAIQSGVRVEDWRDTPSSGIFTTLFYCEHKMGAARAGDDLAAIDWVPVADLPKLQFAGSHGQLAEILREYLEKR